MTFSPFLIQTITEFHDLNDITLIPSQLTKEVYIKDGGKFFLFFISLGILFLPRTSLYHEIFRSIRSRYDCLISLWF
jgi:hypothetical protein